MRVKLDVGVRELESNLLSSNNGLANVYALLSVARVIFHPEPTVKSLYLTVSSRLR